MDLWTLRSFLGVIQHGAIGQAAKSEGLTQPALSRRIQKLEAEIGAPLFIRSRRGVTLTEAGRLVAQEARLTLTRWRHLKENVESHLTLQMGAVRVGGGATAVSFILPEAIAQFQERFSGVRFQVKEAGSRDIEVDVLSGDLELGVVTLPLQVERASQLECIPLLTDDIIPIAPLSHPLFKDAPHPIEALSGQSVVGYEGGSAIRKIIDDALHLAEVQVYVRMELRSIPAILQMIKSTQSLAFVSHLSQNAWDERLGALPIEGLKITRALALIYRRGHPLSSASSAFAERLTTLYHHSEGH